MRVLMIANTLPPADLSGVGEQVLQLTAGLRAAGHEVELLGRGPGGARGPKLLFPLTVIPPLVSALRRFRPDVVQVHESDGAFAAFLTAVLAPGLDPPPRVIALLQVSYMEEARAVRPLRSPDGRLLGRPGAVERRFRWLKAPLQIALGWLTVAVADCVLAPSAATAAELERDYGAGAVAVVPNATGGLAIALPAAPSVPEETGFLLFVGRLRIRKGVEVLLAALARLVRGGLAPRLLIAGDGEHRRRLAHECARLGLDDRVRFLGRCSAAELGALLARCRALVVPSTYEGMPLVVLEAMAAGRPVVASAVSGIPEVVGDGETGWLVPAEDPERLAEALREVLANEEEANRRGQLGRQRVAERYSPRAAAAAWERALREPSPHSMPPADAEDPEAR